MIVLRDINACRKGTIFIVVFANVLLQISWLLCFSDHVCDDHEAV